MSRRQDDRDGRTPHQRDAASRILERQLHERATEREIALDEEDQLFAEVEYRRPDAVERALIDRRASRRRIRARLVG